MAGIYTVRQVNTYIKNMFTQDYALNRLQVKGEVSGCKYHPSGHIYFTLKDESGTLACVMFAGNRSKGLSFVLQNGLQVVVEGSISTYERDSRYQMYAAKITREGIGELYRRYEELKAELQEMGMFDACYKQPIPRYARTIGIVTASSGAAIHDIMNIAARRNPYVQLILAPAQVQGTGAAESIVKAIERLDAMHLDCMIVGRGGGSIEDLWAFNEEIVARAIFDCDTPVISAVGHETDTTIADFVADLRAPTPSVAAELAVSDYRQFLAQLEAGQELLDRAMNRKIETCRQKLERVTLELRMQHPKNRMATEKQYLSELEDRLQWNMGQQLERIRYAYALMAERLEGLSPLKKLTGGYGYISGTAGAVKSVRDIDIGETVQIRLQDGGLTAQVTDKQEMSKENGREGMKRGKRN